MGQSMRVRVADRHIARITFATVAVAFAAFFTFGCGGEDEEPAVAAFREVLEALSNGQEGRAYDRLHHAQRAIVTRDEFIECYDAGSVDVELVSVDETFTETLAIPGTPITAESVAITGRLRVSNGSNKSEDTDTFHMFLDGEEWTWVLDADHMAVCGGN